LGARIAGQWRRSVQAESRLTLTQAAVPASVSIMRMTAKVRGSAAGISTRS
jgi:hypothetical protein